LKNLLVESPASSSLPDYTVLVFTALRALLQRSAPALRMNGRPAGHMMPCALFLPDSRFKTFSSSDCEDVAEKIERKLSESVHLQCVGVLISFRLFLFSYLQHNQKRFFLDGLKKSEQRSHKFVELRGEYVE
jgi:hypothetical protein